MRKSKIKGLGLLGVTVTGCLLNSAAIAQQTTGNPEAPPPPPSTPDEVPATPPAPAPRVQDANPYETPAPPPEPAPTPEPPPVAPNQPESEPDSPLPSPAPQPPTDLDTPEPLAPAVEPAPEPSGSTIGIDGSGSLGGLAEPAADAEALKAQGSKRPTGSGELPAGIRSGVFAEDWWSHTRPALELHGGFRTRGELFYKFALGRIDDPDRALWARPIDSQYTSLRGSTIGPAQCTRDERSGGSDNPADGLVGCSNNTQSSANLRFRLNPTLHVSDNVRISSQIDMLDNVVLGSTPAGYAIQPSSTGGYAVVQRAGYAQYSYQDDTIEPPRSGVNGVSDSVAVKRAWGEYTTPLGELRFGRMPNHWGLGMLYNSGDGNDDDYQSTMDRIMFSTHLRPVDLTLAGMWDFPNEGAIGRQELPGGQAYDLGQLDDVDQWGLILLRRKDPELTELTLAKGDPILNFGTFVTLRQQLLANDPSVNVASANFPGADPTEIAEGLTRRAATIWTPDLWGQFLYKKFRFELEFAFVWGSIDTLATDPATQADFTGLQDPRQKLRQFGIATQLEQKFVEDRLHLNFNFGWASGDPDAFDPDRVGNLVPGQNERQINDDTNSTFRFHPSYRVDLVLHRYLLDRVQGTYYFNPDIGYDFLRDPNGQRIGGTAGVVWSRASEFVQAPGHARNLGLELHASLYFQAKDGALNDKPGELGGFYSALQYAVLFPLAGLGYQSRETADFPNAPGLSAAHLLRLFLGINF